MRYADAMATAIMQQGADVMFGVLGDANMHLGDRYAAQPGARFIATAHEAGAVLMAAGYACVSRRVGLATVTHGAITNAVGALFEASRGRTPLVLLAGDTAASDRFNLQNLPHRDIVIPTGAHFMEAASPGSVWRDVADAFRHAEVLRGPVVLNIPSDFQRASVETAMPLASLIGITAARTPSTDSLQEAAAAIASSSRPLVLGGRGVALAGCEEAVAAFAERIGAPVATTLRGKSLFAGNPFNIGICGTLADPPGLDVISRADCVIAFGASLSWLTTLRGTLFADKRVIQIDSEPTAFERFLPVTVGIVGDLETTASSLSGLLDELDAGPSSFRSAALAETLQEWRVSDRKVRQESGPLDIRDALHRINAIAPSNRTLTIDAGRFAHEALRIMEVAEPPDYVHALNIAQIGMSLSYGIGGAVGRPDRLSVVVIGDGGFMLGGLTEFNTAVRIGARVVVFVMNDSAYGAEYYRFIDDGMNADLITFDWPDLAELARALGGTGITVRELTDFDAVARALEKSSGPILVDVILDRDLIPDPGAH